MTFPCPKIAIVHDWLVTYAGAERVLEQILLLYPQADLFSIIDFLPPEGRGYIQNKPVTTSFIQGLPGAREHYRQYLPLLPLAIEQLDVSKYDLVISSSYAVAKGILTGPDQLHLCYCHSPARYAWDLQHQYLTESGFTRGIKGWIARALLHYLRIWDYRTANGVDAFIANSAFIARRIQKVYQREAIVINPPVNVAAFPLGRRKDEFYLTASRLVPYKKVDLIVEAFAAMPERQLVVIGDGPEWPKVKQRASSNVTLLGYQAHEVLVDYMQRARAFVFAAEEDFGIVPVEAQAAGTPVIAFGKGGVLETVSPLNSAAPTGVFFDQQTPEAICAAVYAFEAEYERFSAIQCRENALQFSNEAFQQAFATFVEARWAAFVAAGRRHA